MCAEPILLQETFVILNMSIKDFINGGISLNYGCPDVNTN